jgi:hypothetical protein
LDTFGFFNLYIISDTKVAFGIKDQIDHYDDEQPVVTRNEAALNLYKKCDLQLMGGQKEHLLFINGEFVDEFYRSKLLSQINSL